MAPIDIEQSLANLKLERDAIALYDALAAIEKDPRRAEAFRAIAANERRHADVWAGKLRGLGANVPEPEGPRLRVRTIVLLARLFGTHAVRDLVQALEGDEEQLYTAQASPEVEGIAADEREHAEIWKRLSGAAARPTSGRPPRTDSRSPEQILAGERWHRSGRSGTLRAVIFGVSDGLVSNMALVMGVAGASGGEGSFILLAGVAGLLAGAFSMAAGERWHRSGRSGTLRAVIFGVSDGLVSNMALVMGVAGASGGEGSFILLAGVAGLLAGAFSMAAGEYISMQSQRELFERQIALERAELEAMPEEEEAELAGVFRAKGFTEAEAAAIAKRMFADPEHALDTLVREELGLDPDELGSPWGAATGSFLAFAVGAAVPVIPYLFGAGSGPFVASIAVSIVALFAVGAGVSLLTGRGLLYSGARQVLIGAAAAAVTYVVGRAIGIAV